MYENLLNPNEFSSISGVSKQTLLFYEKKNVFKPIFKNEKGFRFYSLEQLDIMVTIQALQTIGLSLKEIQNYIENRNADLIYDLYSNRMIPLKQTVNKYNRTIEMMHVKLDLINKAKSVLLDTIYLEYRPAIQIVKSKEIPADARSYQNNIRRGHVLVNGNYSTLVGNPLEMLKASIGQFDGESSIPANI